MADTTDHKFDNKSLAYLKLNFKTGGTKILNQTCGVRTIIYFFLGKQSFRNWLCPPNSPLNLMFLRLIEKVAVLNIKWETANL